LIEATFNHIKNSLADIDFVVYTGDSARHQRDKELPVTKQEITSAHKKIVKYFESALDLRRVKVIPTLGNNDEYVHDEFGPEYPNALLEALTDIWAPFDLNLGESFHRFGSFVQPISRSLSMVSLNTMHWFKSNPLAKDCDGTSIGSAQFRWLREVLRDARQNSQRVYLMGHVPPSDEFSKKQYLDQCWQEYVNLSGRFADVIAAQFHGHTNTDVFSFVVPSSANANEFDLITVSNKSPPAFAASGVPKVVGVLTNGPSIKPTNNPAMRVYEYLPRNGQILDYTQYFTDFVKDNAVGRIRWKVEYKLKDTYNVNRWSLRDWANVLQNLASGGQLYQDYVKRVIVQTNPALKNKKPAKVKKSDGPEDGSDT